MRRVAAATVALALAVSGCGGSPERPPPTTYFGVNGHVLRVLAAEERTAELDRHLDSIEELGVDFVRANLDWRALQPLPPRAGEPGYDFAALDRWVAALARHRLRWAPIGLGVPAPAWAADQAAAAGGCGSTSPPAKPQTFASMMGAVAKRYGRDGEFWQRNPGLPHRPVLAFEVWNEENSSGTWCPAPDPAAYGRLFVAAAAAVHEVDPAADVVIGGLAAFHGPSPPGAAVRTVPADEFLRDAVAATPELERTADGVAFHAYGSPEVVVREIEWFRGVLDENRLAKLPIIFNETGWFTAGSAGTVPTPEAIRADYVEQVTEDVAAARESCDVDAFALHTWLTLETDTADPEHWYGLGEPGTGDPYPSADAYRTAIEELRSEGTEPAACDNAGDA